jgi:hypothetical protein
MGVKKSTVCTQHLTATVREDAGVVECGCIDEHATIPRRLAQ